MSDKNKKQFGVWMDSQHAIIVGRENVENGGFVVIGHIGNDLANGSSNESPNEKSANNREVSETRKFFKEIAHLMPNIDNLHVTGTGQVQEQFINFLAETPQYKNAITDESTSNRMSDEQLVKFIADHFN